MVNESSDSSRKVAGARARARACADPRHAATRCVWRTVLEVLGLERVLRSWGGAQRNLSLSVAGGQLEDSLKRIMVMTTGVQALMPAVSMVA